VLIASWKLEQAFDLPWKEGLITVLMTIFIIRAVVMKQLGTPLTHADDDGVPISGFTSRTGTGAVTCRFNVNLKGILRFIANKKEEREEEQKQMDTSDVSSVSTSTTQRRSNVEVSVTHIVVKAVARAMSDLPVLNSHHIYYPPLFINGFYPSDTIDISVVPGASSRGSNHIVTLQDVERMGIQEIAEAVARRKHRNQSDGTSNMFWSVFHKVGSIISWIPLSGKRNQSQFGSCIVFTSPDSENSEVDIEVAPAPHVGGANIAVVVGGIRGAVGPRSSSAPRYPILSVSVTIDCPAASVGTCRKFVEKVQKLLQFPEVYEKGTLRS